MAAQRIHIVPHDQGWALKREGDKNVESVHSTQKDAIDAGREMAREDEVDLVVHRQDGTFRNVLTYTNDPMSDNGSSNKKVEAHDVFSVGSRVSWGAILIGAAVALAISGVLWAGGLALGLTAYDQVGPRTLGIAGGIWVLISTLFALFCGGYVVSRVTTGENKTEAAMYGVALWGVLFALAMMTAGAGASTAAQIVSMRPTTDRPLLSEESYKEAGLSEAQIEKLEAKNRELREAASEIDPVSTAWWSFASMVLSLGAAVLGSILGSGPTFSLVRFGAGRQPTATVQPT